MSQMSQFSDPYASSTYQFDQFDLSDNLGLPPPEEYASDLSYSQQTLDSARDSSFTRPSQPPSLPDTLQRVGPDKRKAFVLYSDMSKNQFVDWWLTTDFGKQKRIHWDGRHSSQSWQCFDQVAHMTTGEPKVMCNRCAAILDHPQNSRHGTSTMNKHTNGVNCRRSAATQPNIKQLLRDAVSIIVTKYILKSY
jgi:arylamine N-acetyltransferase